MLEFEFFTALRDLVSRANDLHLTTKDIVQVIPASGINGYYLIYQTKPAKKNA